MTYRMKVTDSLSACGVRLLDFTARIEFRWVLETGDGWNEPREPAHPKLVSVSQLSGPTIAAADLIEWAEEWLGENGREVSDEVQSVNDDAEERRADAAREDAMLEARTSP